MWGRVLKLHDYHYEIDSYIDEIYNSHSSKEGRAHACSDFYVNSHPESSWEHLTSLLYEEDEMTAVDQARSFLPPRGKLNFLDYHYVILVV